MNWRLPDPLRRPGIRMFTAAVLTVTLGGWAEPTSANSAPPGADAIAYGHVLDNGQGVANANVSAYVWPNGPTLAAKVVGTQLQTLRVGRALTDSNGEFEIDVNPTTIAAQYQEGDGSVAVQLVAQDATRRMEWNYSVQHVPALNGAQGSWILSSTTTEATGAPTPDALLDLGSATAWDTGNDPAAWVDETGNAVGASGRSSAAQTVVAGAGPIDGPPQCYYMARAWHNGRPEHFMNMFAWSGARGEVRQWNSITHTLGIGLSVDGEFNDLKAGGTASLTFHNEGGGDVSQGGLLNTSVFNRVNYRDFVSTCSWGQPAQRRPVSVYDFLDTSLFRNITHTYWYNCGSHRAGAIWSTLSAHEVTYEHGMNIIGFNVSSQSGFGAGTKISFHFSRFGYVCGPSPQGPLQSNEVEASNIH